MPKRKPGVQTGDDVNKRFGGRLRLCREMAGRSQSEVGDALGVSFQQIQKYENGTTSISLNRLYDVAKFLQVSISKLLDALHDHSPAQAEGFADGAQAPYGEDDERILSTGRLTKQKVALLTAFNQIDDANVRRHLVGLTEAIVPDADAAAG